MDRLEQLPSEKMTQALTVKVPWWKNGTCWTLFGLAFLVFLWEVDTWCSGTIFVRFKVVFDWLKIALDWFVGHPLVSFPVVYMLGHYYWPNRDRLVSARRHREETRIECPERDADTCIRDSAQP